MADVDISGFTEITEQLSVHGREAAELLQDVLAAVFQPLTAGVYEAGGFIANFSGDGFLAVFPEGPGLDPAALRGMAAAWNFRQAVRSRHSFRTRFGTFSFNARIGLSAGQIRWEIFGAKNQRRHVWFFGGEPVLNATRCRTHADIGSLNADDAVLDALDDRVSVTVEPARFGSAVVDTGPLRIDPLQIDPSPVLPAGPVDPLNADFYPVELIHAHGRGEFRQSVNLFVRLDNPDRDLQRFADALLAAQARYGGYLQDITEGDKGCLALIFWGAPIAMENDLGRALEFVSALQARPEFRIAAGLTCGLAHAGFMGSPAHEVYSCNSKSVNLAARLMSAAPLGEVYLDTAARDRGLDRFDIEFVDHLDLKGFTDPQAAYRLTGTRRAPVGLQISGAMIGRDADLSTLQDDLSACLSGEGPCTAALAGEAGIGKTHLIAELQARGLAGISDVVWHELNADGVLEQPFAPFGRFIASLAGILPDGSDTQRRADFDGWFDGFLNGIEQTDTAAELTRTRSFLAALVDVTQDDDVYQRIGQELREINTARGLRAVFAALSLGGPVILIADDLQYYDAQSRAVLKALADAALPGLAILLVSRLTDAEDLPPLPVAEADLQTVHRLHRLPRADVQALAEQVLGAAVSSDIVDLLSSRSGGNPFYLEQLLLTLGARGALVRRGEGAAARLELRDDAEESLPIGISDLLVARLDKLPAGLREIVQVASVIAGTTSGGQDIDEGLLTALLEDDPDLSLGVEAFIADGLEQHIWDRVAGGAIRFRHTLLRDVAYDMLVSGARRDLHLRAARVLEQMAETPGVTRLNDLAHHFERAGQLDTARQYLEAAGELAQKQYQSVRAIGFFRRLAQLGLPTAQDVEVSIRLGELLNLTGQWQEAAAFLEQALAGLLGAEHRRTEIDILIKLGDVIRKSGDQIRARERLDLARVQARRSGDLDLRCRALAVLAGSHKYAGDYARSLTVYQEALALAEETGDTYLEGVSLAGIGSAHGLLMNCADAAAYNRRAIALLEETGDRLELLYPLVNLGTDLFTLGDDAGALEVLERCLAEADAIGDREGVWIAAHFIGRIELRRGGNGDMGAATAFLVRAMQERAEVGGDSIPFNTAPFLAEAKLRAGDAAGALDLIVRDLTAQHDGAADHEHGRTHLVAARLWRVGEADPESGFQTLARLGPGRDAQAWLKRAYELSVQGGRLGLSTRIAVLLEFAHWLAPDGPDAKIAALVAAARRLAEENDLSAELVEIEAVCVALGVAETDIAADDRLLRPFD